MTENTVVTDDAVFAVESASGMAVPAASSDIASPTIEAIVHMTHELVPGELRIEVSVDPECPGRPSLVFHVRQSSRPPTIEAEIDRELDWHARAGTLAPMYQDRLRLFLE